MSKISKVFLSGAVACLCINISHSARALDITPAQTEGPYYPRVKPIETDTDLTRVSNGRVAKGDTFILKGFILDENGTPLAGARVEIWQTDNQGIYMHSGDKRTNERDKDFQFYGETVSSRNGSFQFLTVQPARYPGRARHIHAKITPQGGATLTTQFYFHGDADLAEDGVVKKLGKAIETVTLKLEPTTISGASSQASVTVVVPKPKG